MEIETDDHFEKIQKFYEVKEIKMSTNRLFNLLVAVVLVMMVLLTVRAGVATSQVAAGSQSAALSSDRH